MQIGPLFTTNWWMLRLWVRSPEDLNLFSQVKFDKHLISRDQNFCTHLFSNGGKFSFAAKKRLFFLPQDGESHSPLLTYRRPRPFTSLWIQLLRTQCRISNRLFWSKTNKLLFKSIQTISVCETGITDFEWKLWLQKILDSPSTFFYF